MTASTAKNTDPDYWTGVVDDLEHKHADAKTRVEEIEERRSAIMLKAQLGDGSAKRNLKKLSEYLRKAELEAEDLGVSLEQARAQKTDAEVEAADQAAGVRAREAAAIAEERMAVCTEIESLTEDLVGAVEKYARLGHEIVALTPARKNQVISRWRIEAFVSPALGFSRIKPLHAKPLSEMEYEALSHLLEDAPAESAVEAS